MNNNKCINLRIRSKKGIKYGYCTKFHKKVYIFCKCNKIEYKQYNSIKNRTTKQSKLDKSRAISLFTNNLNTCYLCGNNKSHLHEVFFGRNRANSIKYGLFIPVCEKCHRVCHNNIDLINCLHKKGQLLFIKNYPELKFLDIFKENYFKS